MSWTERKSNKEILQQVRPTISLEATTEIRKMRYFGHVMRENQSLEIDIMLGIAAEARMDGGWTTSKVYMDSG